MPRESSGLVAYHKNLPQRVNPIEGERDTNVIREDQNEDALSVGPIGQGARRRVCKDPTRNFNRNVAPASGQQDKMAEFAQRSVQPLSEASVLEFGAYAQLITSVAQRKENERVSSLKFICVGV